MIILTNCLTEVADEGCLKVANSLIKRIKQRKPETLVATFGESPKQGAIHFSVNKLLLNPKLLWFLWRKNEPILYIPAVAKAHSMAARIFLLSLAARRGIKVVFCMQYETGTLARKLLQYSKAEIITLSHSSYQYYRKILGQQVTYLKAGVDTEKFHPVEVSRKKLLREKYHIPTNKKIILHVGHMRAGRNVAQLLKLEEDFHGVLVASTYASSTQDEELRKQISARENVTVLDTYLPNIEEVYQLSDAYLFPVVAFHNCIDVPLSAMEAAACNVPVVATQYGELKELLDQEGFYKIESFEPEHLNALLRLACRENKEPRGSVLQYDWALAVEKIMS